MKSVETLQLCDACVEGRLHPKTRSQNEEYKGAHGQVTFLYSVCDVCGSELLDAADLLNNKREWVRFKKRVDGIPLGSEIAAMRKKHNLTQPIAAAIFGGGPVAFSKYENDDLIPDESMVGLLKLAIDYPDTIKRLAKVKGINLLAKYEFSGKSEYFVEMNKKLGNLFFSIPSIPERRAHKRVKQSKGSVLEAKKVAPSRPLSKSSKTRVMNISNGSKSWVLH